MRVAAVDVGTNSVRLLVVEAAEEGVVEVERRTIITRLGEGVDSTERLAPAAIARTLAALAAYRERLTSLDVDVVRVVATSACRDAANRDQFLAPAAEVLEVQPEVISGEVEAGLAFRGAISGVDEPPPWLVVDVGGGSTEFVYGEEAPGYLVSVDVGSVRLTERAVPDRPAPPAQVEAARREVVRDLRGVQLPAPPRTPIGVAGTFTSLAAFALDLPAYDPERVHGSRLTAPICDRLVDRLAAMTVAETAAIPSLDPARAPVLLGGAIVVAAVLRELRLPELLVSEHDLLDGVALGLLDG